MIAAVMKLTGWGRSASIIGMIALALLAAGVAAKTWFYFHDRGVIEAHEAEITLDVTEKTLSAERSANSADRAIEARNRARAGAIDERMSNAILTFPDAAVGGVGPVTQSVLDELRNEGAGADPDPAGGAD